MKNEKDITLTKEGYDKLVAKLEHMKTVKRAEVAEKLKLARSYGDLSENSEYDEAKDDQARLEADIIDLEKAIKNAKIIETGNNGKDEIAFGSTVKIYDVEFDEELIYTIVGSKEVDLKNNKISSDSPVGKALIGKKAGETVTVTTQAGSSEFKVLEIM